MYEGTGHCCKICLHENRILHGCFFHFIFFHIIYIYISYELRGFILLFCASFATFEHLYNSSDEYPIDSFVDFEVARVFFGACQPILLPLGGRCLEGPAKS